MIIVNARFLTQKITGVQRYAIEMCLELKRRHPLVKFVSPKKIMHEEFAAKLGVERFGVLSGHLWEQIELPFYASNYESALIINLCNTGPVLYQNKLVVLHDIAFERFPMNFSFIFRTMYRVFIPQILHRSRIIVTSSEFSKEEISGYYKIEKERINVIPCACSSGFSMTKSKEDGYILAVSSISPHKNFRSLVHAFDKIDDHTELHIVGDVGKNFSDTGLFELIKKNKKIKLIGRVTDQELRLKYSNALCFAFPSIYEGFGIPPLEAQACGCPCLVSRVASLPEVYGDSVLYCDPYSIDDIALKLKAIVADSKLRQKLIQLGYVNVKRYSYRRSAIEMIKLIEGSK